MKIFSQRRSCPSTGHVSIDKYISQRAFSTYVHRSLHAFFPLFAVADQCPPDKQLPSDVRFYCEPFFMRQVSISKDYRFSVSFSTWRSTHDVARDLIYPINLDFIEFRSCWVFMVELWKVGDKQGPFFLACLFVLLSWSEKEGNRKIDPTKTPNGLAESKLGNSTEEPVVLFSVLIDEE